MVTPQAASRLGCWPTEHQRQLLLAALGAGAEAQEAWRRWRSSVDLATLDAGSFRLLPLLYANLSRRGVDDPWMAKLKGVYRQSWYRNNLLFHQTAGILTALHDAGIETLVLKGIPLSLLSYADNGARPMSDADVAVRIADAARAVRLLQDLGWHSHRPLLSIPSPHRGSWGFVDKDGREIDLHWHVFNDCLSDDADDDLWAAAQPLLVKGASTRALAPADGLLHVLVHGIHWNPVPSIRWIPDAAAIVAAAGDRLDWDRLLAQAARRRFLPIVTLGLRYLHDVLAVPVPSSILVRLAAREPTALERIDLWSRVDGGALSGACRTWFGYLRSLDDTRAWPGPIGFLQYVRSLWLVDGYRDLLSTARGKVQHRFSYRVDASPSLTLRDREAASPRPSSSR